MWYLYMNIDINLGNVMMNVIKRLNLYYYFLQITRIYGKNI
jgi:hypothetical protein